MKGKNVVKEIKIYAILTLVLAMISVEIHLFRFANNFTIGGIAGLAILLGELALTPSIWNAILNMALLVTAFAILGKDVGIKTAYACVFVSVSLALLERFVPLDVIPHEEPLLDLVACICLRGLASGIVFNLGASTGGTDVLALICKKKFHVNVGTALIWIDLAITICAFFLFGWTTGLYSLLGLPVQSFAIDYAIRKINLCKNVMVVTDNDAEITKYIHQELNRGATVYTVKGSYSGEEHKMLQTVLSKRQAIRLSQFLSENYPESFIMVSEVDKIIGQGFHYFQ